MKKILLALAAAAAVPFAGDALLRQFLHPAFAASDLFQAAVGAALAALLALVTPLPRLAYVLFHEAAHAVAVRLGGGRVEEIRVGKDGGHVLSDRSNLWIRLAPYLLPVGPALTMLFWMPARWWIAAQEPGALAAATAVERGVLGFLTAVHFWYNLKLLTKGTTDVEAADALPAWALSLLAALVTLTLFFRFGLTDRWFAG